MLTHLKDKGKNTGLLLDLNRQNFRLKGRDLVWVCHLCCCTLFLCAGSGEVGGFMAVCRDSEKKKRFTALWTSV